jgi:hemerythrin superfamily protein
MHDVPTEEINMPNRIQSIVSKSVGKVKGVKARLDGLVGVFKTLAEQHAEVKVLLRKLQDNPEMKAELWPDIRRNLLSHEKAELREVYSVLRMHSPTAELADHHDEEAGEMEGLIDEIETADPDTWQMLYDELVDSVSFHASEEEREIFPKALQVIGDKAAKQLDDKFLAAQKQFAAAV